MKTLWTAALCATSCLSVSVLISLHALANDKTREVTGVDQVQNFDPATGTVKGIGGRGVQVGVFDYGFDVTHGDFAGRVVQSDAPMEYHGTHMAGTIAGSGFMSDKQDSRGKPNNGGPYQWRGMAPLAELININQMPRLGRNGINPDTHMYYIEKFGMDVSNHSYSFSFDGTYDASNETRDQLVRGDAISGGRRVPGRLAVTSAGNNGVGADSGGNQVGYFSLTKQVKNLLVVGAWSGNSSSGKILATSSLGPTHDGRIKPDVVAPGVVLNSTGHCYDQGSLSPHPRCMDINIPTATIENFLTQNFYTFGIGTSPATAAATGVVALVLEQYAKTYGIDLDAQPPLPSTLRGAIIHSATDIVAISPWEPNPDGTVQPTPGPDFVTGWGLINAEKAVALPRNRLLLEDVIAQTCHAQTYSFVVPAGATQPVRITLAWDDVAGSPKLAENRVASLLVNDLDLVLIDPNDNRHYPWQLDQQILAATSALKPIPEAEQTCGRAILVKREFMPVANPVHKGNGDPANVNDTIPTGGIPAARRGPDHLNNVEVVDAPPIAGTWRAVVSGFQVRQGPQRFSLLGANFTFVQSTQATIAGSANR